MKEKKRRAEENSCRFCSRPVGKARGFVKSPPRENESSSRFACLHHPGVLTLGPRDFPGSTLFIKRENPSHRDGRFLTVDLDSWHKGRGLGAGSPEAKRALDSLINEVAGADARAGGQALANASRLLQTENSTSPSLGREKGKGGVGGGWGFPPGLEGASETPRPRREKDPRENLFRDLREQERERLSRSRNGKNRGLKSNKKRAAVEAGRR